jgi:hypothetical protein
MTDEAKSPQLAMSAKSDGATESVSPLTAVGFCSKCGIVREDYKGYPVTDCLCTAKKKHKEDCVYVKAVGMWISVASCEKHGYDACEECDCTCGAHKKEEPTTSENGS